MKQSRTNPKKMMAVIRHKASQAFIDQLEAEKERDKKQNLFNHTVKLLVNTAKDKKLIENRAPEVVIKEVEVLKKVPYPVIKKEEVIKEVPYEIIKEVPKYITQEVIKEVPVEIEVIKRIPFEVEVEVLVDNPETIRAYEVQINENINKIDMLKASHQVDLLNKNREVEKLKENFNSKLEIEKNLQKTIESKYKVALVQSTYKNKDQVKMFNLINNKNNKKIKRLSTYSYLLTLYSLTQILAWIIL